MNFFLWLMGKIRKNLKDFIKKEAIKTFKTLKG